MRRNAVAGCTDYKAIPRANFQNFGRILLPSSEALQITEGMEVLGVIVWQMVAGKAPFRGSPTEVMYQHQHASLPIEQLKDVPQPVPFYLRCSLEGPFRGTTDRESAGLNPFTLWD